ncbi:MAG: flagellin lysine-N-methylase [Oscillospiraceae bacterium]|nr:flagellin lysine-N-methylase [Oscillospiraceae bacterium]
MTITNFYAPAFYKKFQCIGSACSDNCCIGWEIDIDEKTAAAYGNTRGDFGKRLSQNIALQPQPHFILKGERCPFLNSRNLCDIILNLGAHNLCEICDKHPRFFEWFDGLTECGLGLCCEQACRLLFAESTPLTFESWSAHAPENQPNPDDKLFSVLHEARTVAFALAQNRTFSLPQRMVLLLCFAEELQQQIFTDGTNFETILNYYRSADFLKKQLQNQLAAVTPTTQQAWWDSLLALLAAQEPIDETWPTYLQEITTNLPKLLGRGTASLFSVPAAYFYEHLLVYFIYRYFLKAAFDGEVLARIKFACISTVTIALFNAHFTTCKEAAAPVSPLVFATKLYSKQVEYCTDNLDAFLDESALNPFFSLDCLIQLFLF